VFSRAQLLQEVWGYDYFGGTRTVDVHVRRLRAKLGSEHEALIGTIRNVGYRFVADRPRELGVAPRPERPLPNGSRRKSGTANGGVCPVLSTRHTPPRACQLVRARDPGRNGGVYGECAVRYVAKASMSRPPKYLFVPFLKAGKLSPRRTGSCSSTMR
jgi:hypothetical protein